MMGLYRDNVVCTFHLDLAPGWRLRADPRQWMICEARQHRGGTKWQPVIFIASNKAVLRQSIERLGIDTGASTNPALNGFLCAPPPSFGDWMRLQMRPISERLR